MFLYRMAQQGIGNRDAVIQLVEVAASAARFDRVRGSYAYASAGGAVELIRALSDAMPNWETVRKRWLISMDWGHTEPGALRFLASLENSEVRIPFAEEVLLNTLRPRTCFHPKTAIFDRSARPGSAPMAVALGSANMTISGLRTGHEDLSVAIWTGGALARIERDQLAAMKAQSTRLATVWNASSRLTAAILERYEALRTTRRPQIEDASEAARAIERNLTIPFDRIAALRAARHLWIRVDYVTPNLGIGVPGNQIDLQRGSRVFFGFTPSPVARNAPLGSLDLNYRGNTVNRNMRFGNNQMDKLDLPVPGGPWPMRYDNTYLQFERTGAATFTMRIGTTADARRWKRQSDANATTFRMSSGREWGVY